MFAFICIIAVFAYIAFSPSSFWNISPVRVLQGVCWGSLLLAVVVIAL